LFIFFIPYILCEVPSNLLLKNVRPSLYLSGIMAAWGVITIGMGVTQSFGGLVGCRFLLGVFEAGFFPGCAYLISMSVKSRYYQTFQLTLTRYYKRLELQLRINLFFCASILAGAFSGLLAYAIAHLDGHAGYSGWRWIFIIEGWSTISCSII
jgi:MFS family permease